MGVRDWASQTTRQLQADRFGLGAKDGRDSHASVPCLVAHAQLWDMAMVALADLAEMVEALNRSSMAHFVADRVVGPEDMVAPMAHHADGLAARRTVADGRYRWGPCRGT